LLRDRVVSSGVAGRVSNGASIDLDRARALGLCELREQRSMRSADGLECARFYVVFRYD